MMKYAVFIAAAIVGSASAFAPSTSGRTITSLNAEKSISLPFANRPALLDGSMAGDVGFDPLGLSEINAVGLDLYWMREAEIKHCRLAMLAVVGFVWVEAFGPAPGCEVATAKNQIQAFWQFWDAQPEYIGGAICLIILLEMIGGIATTTGRESGMRAPGDFGFDPLKVKGDTEKYAKLQLQEVKNGRLAMWAAAGEILQGCTTDTGALGNFFGA